MLAIAKRDNTDHRLTLRIPARFGLAGTEVWVLKDEATGKVTLSPKPSGPDRDRLRVLFDLLGETPLPDGFLASRPKRHRDTPQSVGRL